MTISFREFPEELDLGEDKQISIVAGLPSLTQPDKPHEPVAFSVALVRSHNAGPNKVSCVPLVNRLPRRAIVAHFDGPRNKEITITSMRLEAVPAQADAPRFEVELDPRVGFIV